MPTVQDSINAKRGTEASVAATQATLDAATRAHDDALTADTANAATIKAEVAPGPILNVIVSPDGTTKYEVWAPADVPPGYSVNPIPVATAVPSAAVAPTPTPTPNPAPSPAPAG